MSAEDAVWAASKLIAWAILLQTAELLQLRRNASAAGVWDWRIVRREFEVFPRVLRWFFDLILGGRGFLALLGGRVLASSVVLFFPLSELNPAWMAFLWLSTLLIAVRWRGTFNGGSDCMTLVVTLGLWVAQWGIAGLGIGGAVAGAWAVKAGLAYIAVQGCGSYFIAGVVKLRNPDWRSGRALSDLLRMPAYDVPEGVRRVFCGVEGAGLETGHGAGRSWDARGDRHNADHLRSRARLAFLSAWAVIGFECAFPFALTRPLFMIGFAACAFAFHLGNVYVLGLNRFFWAWLAVYPAVFWLAGRLG